MRMPEMYVWNPGRSETGSRKSEVRKAVAAAAWAFFAGLVAGYGWLFLHISQRGG